MTRTVIIEPEAHEDLSRSFDWYEETSPGMGQVFIDATREVVSRLTTTPDGSTGTRDCHGEPFSISMVSALRSARARAGD